MKNIFIFLILGIFLLPGTCPAMGFSGQFHGVGYGPYHYDNQHPGTTIPADQIKEDLRHIWEANFRYLRTFTVADGMDQVPLLARRYYPDLKICLGVPEDGCTHDETKRQLDLAVSLANSYDNVVAIIVGDECLPGDVRAETPPHCPVSVATLCDDLKYVRERVKPSVIVTTNLSWGAAHDNHVPELKACSYIDVWMINIYPFYKGPPPPDPDRGIECTEQAIRDNLDWNYFEFNGLYSATGKQIMIGEHGWPTAGEDYGRSHPGINNQHLYFLFTTKWLKERNWPAFYFEFFDEPWKADPPEPGGIGPHWGLCFGNSARKWDLTGAVSPINAVLLLP
jgi:glucan 1,3-beta-glucosidase